ncbi:MAG: RnfABCDGE type electron transport complex subunit D [Planctomycetes bacterium]|nr:RnfABCDGE type electron transport complex subunit D [Planctomycetota bacterium]
MPEPRAGAKRPRKRFLRQPQMLRVLYALAPVALAGVYFFGWRVLALLAACTAAGAATEWLMASRRGGPLTTANFVTCALYTLSLPPTMPFWMAAVGIVVGVLFGKEVFGGFGRNFANPAIVGRAFVYVAFPIAMTGSFVPAFRGWPGGFAHWSLPGLTWAPDWLASAADRGVDAVTAATPMVAQRDFGFETPILDLFLGNIGGTFRGQFGEKVLAAGCIGEVSALAVLVGAAYLLVTRTANWRLMLGPLLGAVAACVLFRHVAGIQAVPPLAFTLYSGALLYGAVFMVTEPVSAPKKTAAIWAYGVLIGFLIVFLRWKAQFAGAVAFAILLGNTVGPSLDLAVAAWQDRKKPKREEDSL